MMLVRSSVQTEGCWSKQRNQTVDSASSSCSMTNMDSDGYYQIRDVADN